MHTKISKWITVGAAAFLATAPGARAFSLLGPFSEWQVQALSYQWDFDIGGPMNLNDGFRWNVPVITYACDKAFIDYFGPPGVNAIDQAFSYFNDLDPAARISPDLSEYSTSTLRENYAAAALGLRDLKSTAMKLIIEELGFADPIRYTFTLRSRETETVGGVTVTNYSTIIRNFDPVTLQPSRYVNGTLYTYEIREFQQPFQHADALEVVVFGNSDFTAPVASGLGYPTIPSSGPNSVVPFGRFRTGLTRDDVGGLRWLYHPNNIAIEGLLTNVTAGFGGTSRSGWIPFVGITNQFPVTNTLTLTGTNATNQIINVGPRGGRNKLKFQRVFFDFLIGSTFTAITNEYTDVTIGSNLTMVVQTLQRGIAAPDFIFTAGDLGLTDNLFPNLTRRTDTGNWVDNDALNGVDEVDNSSGPGVISPPVQISFSNILPVFLNSGSSAFLDGFPGEDIATFSGVWGSFDGSTNAPIIYPFTENLSLPELRRRILNYGRRR